MERPLRYSWVIEELLAVGERPRSLAEIAGLGFRAVLSLLEEHEVEGEETGQPPAELALERIPIRDGLVGGVPTLEDIRRAVAAIQKFQEARLPTYVHCYAGIGRSPTVCAAYLARCRGLRLGEALRHVKKAHPFAQPTPGQLLALASFLDDSMARELPPQA